MILFAILNHNYLPGQHAEYSVQRIYQSPNHDAFTSLIKFKDEYYCAFRSGEHHVFGRDGQTKIIVSKDGKTWTDLTTLSKPGIDLRDPKLSITPNGKIMVIMGGSDYQERKLVGRKTYVSFSDASGAKFSDPVPVLIDENVRSNNDWLWRVTWFKNTAYGVLYQGNKESTSLVHSVDGINFSLINSLDLDGRPNEATIRFDENGTMYILHRREEGDKVGMWGWSSPPYKSWKWIKLEERIGGPDFEIHPNGQVWAGGRMYRPDGAYVGILKGTLKGEFEEFYRLPSGGDCSYPGFVIEKSRILVSYYSSHEGNADIYLAEIPLE